MNLQKMHPSPQIAKEIKSLWRKLLAFERESKIETPKRWSASGWRDSRMKLQHMAQALDKEVTRLNLYNRRNPKNLFLMSESLQHLIPIDKTDWMTGGFWRRLRLIAQAPSAFVCAFFIPIVDHSKDKHGWIKLINCFHIISSPILTVVFLEALLFTHNTTLYPHVNITRAMWTMCVSVPLAICVFCTSRTDRPPYYHKVKRMIQ